MAHVVKRGKKWYGSWKDHSGARQRHVLSGVTTKREAQALADAFEAKGTRVKAGVEKALDNSAEIRPLIDGFIVHKVASSRYEAARYCATALAPTLGGFTSTYGEADKQWPPRRQTSFEEVRDIKRTFVAGELGVTRVDQITPDLLEQYVQEHRGKLTVRGLNVRIGAIKTLLTWARKAGRIDSNPIADVSRAGVPAKSQRVLKPEQVVKLLSSSPEPERTIWLTFLTTGLRKGEFVKLRWPAVNVATGTIRIHAETSKGKRHRDIPMVPELLERMKAARAEARDPEGYVFTTRTGGPVENNLPRRLRQALERAGLDEHAVSLHGLRHTFATSLLLNGANIVSVSKLLGHVNVTQTLNTCAHALPENLREAISHLPYGDPTESQAPETTSQLVA